MLQHIINLFSNNQHVSCDKPTRCNQCMGIGLIKKNIQNTSNIPNCKCTSNLSCYKCENNKFKGLYEECETCWGSGKKIGTTIK